MKMKSLKLTHCFDVIKKEPELEEQSDIPLVVFEPNDAVKQEYHYKEELDVAWDERDNNYDVNQENHNFSNTLSQKLDYPIVLIQRLSDTLISKHFATVKNESGAESIGTTKSQKQSYTTYYRKFCPDCNQTRSPQKKGEECKNCGTRWSYKCEKCSKQFPTYKRMIRHLKTKCIEGNYYACFKCNYKSLDKYKVSVHLKNVHSIVDSLNRIEIFKSENVQDDVGSGLHKCSKSEKQFDKLPSLLRHTQICGQAKYNGQSENFATLVNVVQGRCSHYCVKCNQTVENEKIGKHHQKACENCQSKLSFKCKECNQILPSYDSMNLHLKNKHAASGEVFQCPECDYQTPTVVYLTRHVQRKHIIEIFVCPECGGKYKNSTAFQKHSQTCNKEPKFQCDFCSHKSKSKSNLRCHVLNVHTEGNEISCPRCNKIMKNKACLHVHLSYCKIKSHLQCSSCPFKTKYKFDLKTHYENKHSNTQKKEACPHCSKEFKNKASLRSHLGRCGKPLNFSCNYCRKAFKIKQTLARHVIRVHSNKTDISCELPYLHCDDCSYKTKFKGDLSKHVVLHLNNNTEECPKCKKYFTKGYFNRHTENCGREPLRCDQCDYHALVKECLKRHIINMHSKGYEMSCSKCGRICKNITYLRSHLQRCGTKPHLKCDSCSYKTKSKYDLKKHAEKWHSKKVRAVHTKLKNE